MTYAAPLAEMRFAMHELADLAEVQALPGYEDASSDLVDAVLEEAGKFGSEVLAPLNVIGDRDGSVYENGVVRTPAGFTDAYRQFVDGGWNGISADPEYGGQGLPWLISTAVSEIWHAANMSFGLCPMLTQGAAEVVHAFGSDEIKETFLHKLVSGEWTGTMNLTEPQAGSDLSRVRTRAVPEGDHYLLTGQKIFITWGEHDMAENIVHMVLARLPDAPEGTKGISLFLVPKYLVGADGDVGSRNDVRCVSIEHKLGIKASPTAVLSFGDNGGAVGYLIGAENRGLEHMFVMMNNARLAVGLEGVGIAERAYQLARAFALERVQGRMIGGDDPTPVTIARHPHVQRMLLTMKTRTEAARALAYFVASCLDFAQRHPETAVRQRNDSLVGLLTPVVKAWSTDIGIETADTGIQVHGGMGYIEESGAPQHLRDARIASIYEGTNGIQAQDLMARKVVRDRGAAIYAFIALMRELDADLDRARTASDDVGVLRGHLSKGLMHLEQATAWVLKTYPVDPRPASGGARYYLELLGTVAGGWLMAKAALVALRKLADGEGDPRFLRAKVLSARFFADHFVARSGGLHDVLVGGGDVLTAMEPELL